MNTCDNAKGAYWKSMTHWKHELLCIEEMYRRTVMMMRIFKLVVAMSTCASVAAWAIWERFPFAWSAIVIAGQVASLIMDVTPYHERQFELSAVASELSRLYQKVERNWFKIANGKISPDDINELRCDYSDEWEAIKDNHMAGDYVTLPDKKVDEIDCEMERYFSIGFCGDAE